MYRYQPSQYVVASPAPPRWEIRGLGVASHLVGRYSRFRHSHGHLPTWQPLYRPAPHWRPARRLGGGLANRQLRDRAYHRFVGHEGDGVVVVRDVERGALEQGVPGLPVIHLYPDTAPPEEETEGQAGQPLRKPGSEAKRTAVVAHASEPGHRGNPGAGQRSQVNAVAGVVIE